MLFLLPITERATGTFAHPLDNRLEFGFIQLTVAVAIHPVEAFLQSIGGLFFAELAVAVLIGFFQASDELSRKGACVPFRTR